MDDEEPNRVDLSKLRTLKPVFKEDGVLTVGNSPSCNDGAAALVVMAEDEAAKRGLKPMARVVGYAGAALAPEWFTIAPIAAIKRVLQGTGLSVADIDLFEINEAFSAVSLAVNRELENHQRLLICLAINLNATSRGARPGLGNRVGIPLSHDSIGL